MNWVAKRCRWGWLIVMLAVLGAPPAAAASGRVALVIGNGGYAEKPLKNPLNDAQTMAALLQKLGFTVTEKTDLDLKSLRREVNAFLDRSKGAELRLFYYSGHGATYDGDNYLLPIGHDVTRQYELPDQAYSLKTLLRGLRDQGGVNLVLLDACRDAPFGDAKSVWDDSKGMKPVQPQEGVLIGYAAQNGRTASDNSRETNSLYTKHLLRELDQSLELREALMRVRQTVYDESRGEQRPTTEDEVLGKVYLAGAEGPEHLAGVEGPEQVVRDYYDAIHKGQCQKAIQLNPNYTRSRCEQTADVEIVRIREVAAYEKIAYVNLKLKYRIKNHANWDTFAGDVTLERNGDQWIITDFRPAIPAEIPVPIYSDQ